MDNKKRRRKPDDMMMNRSVLLPLTEAMFFAAEIAADAEQVPRTYLIRDAIEFYLDVHHPGLLSRQKRILRELRSTQPGPTPSNVA